MNDVAEALCRTGRSLYERGYVHASAGNISVRVDDGDGGGWYITPTDACLGTLQPERLARIDALGVQTAGDRASKTLALHQRIYAADAQARCVIHTHATHLVALSLVGVWRPDDVVPPITPYFVMKVGHVPLVGYRRPGDPAAATEVERLLAASVQRGKPIRAVLLERLGPVVWHRSLAEAAATLEELEETARLWLLSSRKAEPLAEGLIEDLRQGFGAVW
jgi:ribulose-5-phosphate 4-epimerase/fuculose-1-phosphate aldolase